VPRRFLRTRLPVEAVGSSLVDRGLLRCYGAPVGGPAGADGAAARFKSDLRCDTAPGSWARSQEENNNG